MMSGKSPHPIDVNVGARIRLRRTLIGMSQERLATQLGITFQQVQKYEKGVNRVGASRLREIAGILGVSMGYFFAEDRLTSTAPEGRDPASDILNVTSFLSTRDGIELNRAFMKIKDAEIRRSIIRLTKALAEVDKSGLLDGGTVLTRISQ